MKKHLYINVIALSILPCSLLGMDSISFPKTITSPKKTVILPMKKRVYFNETFDENTSPKKQKKKYQLNIEEKKDKQICWRNIHSRIRAYPKIPDILKSLIEQAKLRKAEAASKLLFQQFFMPRDQDKIPKVRSTTHL